MKKIEITWEKLNISVKAILLEDENPILCKNLWDKLPMKGIQDHALISGEYLYGYIPMPELCSLCHYKARKKEPRHQQKVGRINVSALQHFSIKYGEVSEYLEASPVAQIDASDLNKIKTVGRRVWESTFKDKDLIVFSITKWPNVDYEIRNGSRFINKKAKELAEEIDSECSRIWLKPPQEVIDLIEGKTTSRIGSFGFYFNSIVFADGLMRSLGIMTLGDILRMADNEKLSIFTIQGIIGNVMSRVVFEFLEYCGFKKLFSFYRRLCEIVPATNNREDLIRLVLSITNYVNRLSGWLLHYFPWHLGINFKRDE